MVTIECNPLKHSILKNNSYNPTIIVNGELN